MSEGSDPLSGGAPSSQVTSSQNHNNLELKNIFNLLNPNSEGEIEIKQINSLIQSLDNLKVQIRSTAETSETSPITTGSQNPTEKKQTGNNNVNGSNGNKQATQKPQVEQKQIKEKEFVETVELRYFPNNKTTLNFADFSNYFNECIQNKELQDDLLQSCFNQFDFNEEAFINSKKIKSIFEIFNDKTNTEEIQNVLKFCGVSNDKMSFDEFKQFFEKNL